MTDVGLSSSQIWWKKGAWEELDADWNVGKQKQPGASSNLC